MHTCVSASSNRCQQGLDFIIVNAAFTGNLETVLDRTIKLEAGDDIKSELATLLEGGEQKDRK